MYSKKVAVVTGSNKGIGYGIVKGLCEKYQGTVYLTSRDVGRGQTAVDELRKLGLNPQFHQLDINDQDSVDKFRSFIMKTHGGIDVLVNNAAIAFQPDDPEPFAERAEKIISVNYFGLLRVCQTLFPVLRNNAQVVNVSSCLGHLTIIPSLDLRTKLKDPNLTISELNKLIEHFVKEARNDPENTKAIWGDAVYSVSKVAISALTILQQRLFDKEVPNRNISVNSVHPGYVDTDLTDHKGDWTIEQGARAPLYLAMGDHGLKGKYIWSDTRVVDWASDESPGIF